MPQAALTVEYIYSCCSSWQTCSMRDKYFKHSIAQKTVQNYIEEKCLDFILRVNDVIELLRLDGVACSPNKVRLYDQDLKAFIKLQKDFSLKLPNSKAMLAEPSQPQTETIMLWIEREDIKLRRQILSFSSRLRKLEIKIKQVGMMRKNLRSMDLTVCEKDDHPKTIDNSYSKSTAELNQSDLIFGAPPCIHSLKLPESSNDCKTNGRKGSCEEGSPFPIMQNLDLAIMNAEPLVEIRNSKSVLSLPDSVDYEEECREIYATLMDKGRKINLMFEIATRTNLVSVLSRNPTILHIMCHGEYDQERKEFYLGFEKATGEIDKLYAEDLKEILSKFESSLKLVFVNACYSEPVGRVFAEAGVPYVIAIQSQTQIADVFARKFANEFYYFIFERKSVKEAFNLARIASADPLSYSCCCAHSHKPQCKWLAQAKQEGFHQAHIYHDPTCTSCSRRRENLHNITCKWASTFLDLYKIDREPDMIGKVINTCCCSPEVPHNELLKFILISDESQNNEPLILFSDLQPGKVQNMKAYNVIDQRFPEKRLVGRNRQLYDLYTALRLPQKVVKLEGAIGSGKTALAKQLANYLYARNHFRSKIALIDMSKLSSVTAFLGKIFSEFELVNDMDTFLETVRALETLFILENCDSFIQENRIEFSQTLHNIASNTKHVRFILVLNTSIDLELQETVVKVGSLYPIDAAKLLLSNTPLEKIFPIEYRSVVGLKESDLFKKYSERISIQTLWWISQKLLQGKKFSAIETELINKFESMKTTEDTFKALVRSSSKQIKKDNPEGFKLIIQISSFPSGVSSRELEEINQESGLNWKQLLSTLLQSQNESTNLPKSPLDREISSPDTPSSKPRSNKLRTRTHFSNSTFRPGHYFWLEIMNPREELIFRPVEIVRTVLYENIYPELVRAEFEKLKSMAGIAVAFLDNVKAIHAYLEKMIENSAICKYGLWRYESDFYQKISKRSKHIISFNDPSQPTQTLKDLQSAFERHDSNFRSCYNLALLQRMIGGEGTTKNEFIEVVEILWLAIPTLYKVFSKDPDNAAFFTSKGINCLNELKIIDEKITLLRIKLHLFLIGAAISAQANLKSLQQTINSESDLIESYQPEISDSKLLQLIKFEVLFSRVLLEKRSEEDLNSESNEGLTRILFMLTNHCEKVLKGITCEFETAKLNVWIWEIKLQLDLVSDLSFKQKLDESIITFQKYKTLKLEIRAHICLAKLYLKFYLKKKEKDTQPMQLQEVEAELDEIRKNNLKKYALKAAQQINDVKSMSTINELINIFNSHIHRKLSNMMVFLHANPLCINQTPAHVDKEAIYIPSFFKSDLIDVLNEKNVVLNLKFEVLTKQSLKQSIDSGCRMLYLSSTMINAEGLIVEDSHCRPALIKYEELKELFMKKSNKNERKKLKIELLIIGSRSGFKLASWFAEEAKIPHVIYFDLNKQGESDFKVKLYQTEYINKFTQLFLNCLIDGTSLEDTYSAAAKDALYALAYSFFPPNTKDEKILQIIGNGVALLPTGEHRCPTFFGTEKFKLEQGKVEDISSQRIPNTILKSIVPFFGRSREFSEIAKYLTQDPSQIDGFLKVEGEKGVGKTRLALEVAWYVVQRSLFPDGVFYLPLEKIHKRNAYDLIFATFQKFGVAMDRNYANFFRKRRVLLIFDDFHTLYTGDVEVPHLLFSIIKRCKIPTIVICTKQKFKEDIDRESHLLIQQFRKNKNDIEQRYISDTVLVPRLHEHHIANILTSITSPGYEDMSYKDALKNNLMAIIRGVPSRVVEFLNENRIRHNLTQLKMLSYYIPFQNLNKRQRHFLKTGNDLPELVMNGWSCNLYTSRHSINFREGMMCQKPESQYEEVKTENVQDPLKKQTSPRDLNTKSGVENSPYQNDNKKINLIHNDSNPMKSNSMDVDEELRMQGELKAKKGETEVMMNTGGLKKRLKLESLKRLIFDSSDPYFKNKEEPEQKEQQ